MGATNTNPPRLASPTDFLPKFRHTLLCRHGNTGPSRHLGARHGDTGICIHMERTGQETLRLAPNDRSIRRGPDGAPGVSMVAAAILFHGVLAVALVLWRVDDEAVRLDLRPETAVMVDLVPLEAPPDAPSADAGQPAAAKPLPPEAMPSSGAQDDAAPPSASAPPVSAPVGSAPAVSALGNAPEPAANTAETGAPSATLMTPAPPSDYGFAARRSPGDASGPGSKAASRALWSLVCQKLDPSVFGAIRDCPETQDWRPPNGTGTALAGVRDGAELVDPNVLLRQVLGPRYLDMSLEEIHEALAGAPLFDAPGLNALPGPPADIGHLSAADGARDRLPPSQPDPYLEKPR